MEKNDDKFIIIARYTTSVEANLAKTKLLAADIQCFVDNENGNYAYQIGDVNLKVWGKDKKIALEVLNLKPASDEESEADDVVVTCPRCKSNNTQYGINRDKANIFFIVGEFFLQSLPFYDKKIYYCNNCKKHFKVKNTY